MRRFLYTCEIRHDGLGKIRTVRGETQGEVEEKARVQLLAWEEAYRRKLERDRRHERNVAVQKSKEHALALTKSFEASRARLAAILRDTLTIDDAIDWNSLKNSAVFEEPEPQPPPEPKFPPEPVLPPFRPSLLDRLSSRRRARSEAAHRERIREPMARWEATCAAIRQDKERALADYAEQRSAWLARKLAFIEKQAADNAAIDHMAARYMARDEDAVAEYCDMVLSRSDYPEPISKEYSVSYDAERRILVVDYMLPNAEDLPLTQEVRYVPTRDELEFRPMRAKDADSFYNRVLCSLCLRTIHEMFEADRADAIAMCVFNGFVRFADPRDGKSKQSCILSLAVDKERFREIDLANVDPVECFRSLKGMAAAKLRDRVAVRPVIQFSKDDPRFVPAVDVMATVSEGLNLATMDWEAFEHLVRTLFEKEFAASGAEVKITRASRDAGVDAVIFDPDPIKGGKIVVQAKRYTNTVGVAAVRDLYGTILNEGAGKGILITTSSFGRDAYEFAANKPITLLDGNNLLFLLEKHGTRARIDLEEAKRVAAKQERSA